MLKLLIFGSIVGTQEISRLLFYASFVSKVSTYLLQLRVTELISFLFFEVIKERDILMTWILEELASFEHFFLKIKNTASFEHFFILLHLNTLKLL